jgi:hypothetical protein
LNDLKNYAIDATDGVIGHVKDFYFDDQSWVVRYLVVHTGAWLLGKNVLISPVSVGQPNWTEHLLPVAITRDQVRHGPDIDTDKPVSRQHEVRFFDYYRYPYYWGGGGLWGAGFSGASMMGQGSFSDADNDRAALERVRTSGAAAAANAAHTDAHLRSCRSVIGYGINTRDGAIGEVNELLVDERTWAIRYLVVDTSGWWLGHRVLIAPQWIERVSWSERGVDVNLTREAVKQSPGYNGTATLNRTWETDLYTHYDRPGYWVSEPSSARARDGLVEALVSTAKPGKPKPDAKSADHAFL